jgi:type III secretion protein U
LSQQDTSEEKTLPPSAKKLREARRKGQIPHSKEMISAVLTVTAFGYLLVRFNLLFNQLGDGLLAAPSLLDQPFPEAAAVLTDRLGGDFAWTVAPFVALLVVAAVVSNIVINGGILAAFDPIQPKMDRLDPIAGFKRMFSAKNLIELLKTLLKVIVVGWVSLLIVASSLQALVEVPTCGLLCAGPILRWLLQPLLLSAAGTFLVLGGIDIGVQRWLFRRDMRMTKSEQKRERKESDGDPMIRRQHKQDRRSGLAFKTGLRNATFIIRSSDVALALRYAAPDATVPVLVARGAGGGALLLLDEARALNLPVVFDADTVALVAPRLKVGRMISQDMFNPMIGCMREAGLL